MPNKKTEGSMKNELEWIRALAEVLTDTGLTEIEIEKDDISLRVAKNAAPTSSHVVTTQPTVLPPQGPAVSAPAPETPASSDAASPIDHPGAVKSPMVGTAYLAPAPGAADFVSIGDKVKEGQTLMIVEAMKTMNEIKSPKSGQVIEILAKDAEPVEYGEALIILG